MRSKARICSECGVRLWGKARNYCVDCSSGSHKGWEVFICDCCQRRIPLSSMRNGESKYCKDAKSIFCPRCKPYEDDGRNYKLIISNLIVIAIVILIYVIVQLSSDPKNEVRDRPGFVTDAPHVKKALEDK